jgi:hypothetical protein
MTHISVNNSPLSAGAGALVNTEDEFHFEAQSFQKPSIQFSTR